MIKLNKVSDEQSYLVEQVSTYDNLIIMFSSWIGNHTLFYQWRVEIFSSIHFVLSLTLHFICVIIYIIFFLKCLFFPVWSFRFSFWCDCYWRIDEHWVRVHSNLTLTSVVKTVIITGIQLSICASDLDTVTSRHKSPGGYTLARWQTFTYSPIKYLYFVLRNAFISEFLNKGILSTHSSCAKELGRGSRTYRPSDMSLWCDKCRVGYDIKTSSLWKFIVSDWKSVACHTV